MVADRFVILLERVYDVRVVWAFEIQVQADLVRDHHELGHRVFRIHAAGAGESLGQQCLYAGAIENHAGGYYARGFLRVRDLLSG